MMGQPNILLVAMLAIGLLAAPGFVQAKGKKDKGGTEATGSQITAVDASAKTVTVLNCATTESKTYKVTSATTIELNGAKATLDDLRSGMKVTITPGDAADTIKSLSATPAPEKKEKKKKNKNQ